MFSYLSCNTFIRRYSYILFNLVLLTNLKLFNNDKAKYLGMSKKGWSECVICLLFCDKNLNNTRIIFQIVY